MKSYTNRRTFIKQFSSVSIVLQTGAFSPIRTYGANEAVRIGGIGVGGKGWVDIQGAAEAGANIVALCDIDNRSERMGKAVRKFESTNCYTDWRKLLEQKDIDAVTVSTPDHMHAPITMAAMQLGKHVYTQKPMTHTVVEARKLSQYAISNGTVSQMGNQHHNRTGYRILVKLIQDGAIGKVSDVHVWSNRPIWPQGMNRPKGSMPVPDFLDWENWIGSAPFRPYYGTIKSESNYKHKSAYHPFNWRGWLDFGTGALGDMGCHIFDPVVWSLNLKAPQSIRSRGPAPNSESYPTWSIIDYIFSGTEYCKRDTLSMTWYDGNKQPPRELLPEGTIEKYPSSGSLFIGEKGVLLCPHGKDPILLPEKYFSDYPMPKISTRDHYKQWVDAIRGDDETTSGFDYAGPLTETVLLGNVALRYPNREMVWDSKSMMFPFMSEANHLLHKTYRRGWENHAL